MTKGLTKDLINEYSILNCAKHFSSGILQNCLIFISANKYIKTFSGNPQIYSWKSKGISEESIKNYPVSVSTFPPILIHYQM